MSRARKAAWMAALPVAIVIRVIVLGLEAILSILDAIKSK